MKFRSITLAICLVVASSLVPAIPQSQQSVSQAEHERLRAELERADAVQQVRVGVLEQRLIDDEAVNKANGVTLHEISVSMNRMEGIGGSLALVLTAVNFGFFVVSRTRSQGLDLSRTSMADGIESLQTLARQTHGLVNSGMRDQLALNLATTKTLVHASPTPENMEMQAQAQSRLAEHDERQRLANLTPTRT